MTTSNSRNNRSVADLILQISYPSETITKKVYARREKYQHRNCLHEDCNVKLSFYNDTDYCSLHQRYHTDARNVI